MYHSITFGGKNTWDDWHLIPKTRPVVNPPQVKTQIVDIPGGDGVIDLTAALTGRPCYRNRTGTWTFIAENGFKAWHQLYSEVMAHLHGRTLRATLEDDPAYYYEGRFTVNAWNSEAYYSTIEIGYDVKPYKMWDICDGSKWLWDPFNFETGIIYDYDDMVVDGVLEVKVIGSRMPYVPRIKVNGDGMQVSHMGKRYDLSRGLNVIADILLMEGENLLTFTGTGRVSIEYAGGVL